MRNMLVIAFTLGVAGAALAQVADSAKPVTGVAKAGLITTWEAAKRVLAARGETLVVRDETTETIATKPHALEREALLASFKSQFKPEDSGYTHGTYELAINLSEKGAKKTFVEVKAKIMAYGRAHQAMAKPDTWDPVPSNGKIEGEVIKAIQLQVGKK
jgi:parvulin-like peptidyl-prolyl isomerase